jgi:hypothetical protein
MSGRDCAWPMWATVILLAVVIVLLAGSASVTGLNDV